MQDKQMYVKYDNHMMKTPSLVFLLDAVHLYKAQGKF